MKIAVITDTHANLPALKAALNAIAIENCEAVFHLGDAIAIGPYSAECIDLIHDTPNMNCVLGNHELYYLNGLPKPRPGWMSEGEVKHQIWTHKQLGERRKSIVAQWPLILEKELEGVKTVFVHYGLTSSRNDFTGVVRNPNKATMDKVFDGLKTEIIFFGHDHKPSTIDGKARYINPGSLGCNKEASARYIIAEYDETQVKIQHHSVRYDDKELYEAFEERKVPEREFIYKAFFGGRFGVSR